ncbi:Leucine rich repeat-containing protein [Ruminococcaceae bacterium YRB3002]|nr:Leucine rich repeat-containing protein [Ruminococcaceae bacterium YRB3002]
MKNSGYRKKQKRAKKIKIAVIIAACVLALGGIGAAVGYMFMGYKGTCGNCTWTMDNKGILRITGTGAVGTDVNVTFGLGKPTLEDVKEIYIEDGITEIPALAVEGMKNLTKVTIPATVTDIGDRAFAGAPAIKEIIVAPDNDYYSSLDGSLYNKDASELITYASGRAETNFTVPENVQIIAAEAFREAPLETIDLPSSVSSIDKMAFAECRSLKSINVGEDCDAYMSEDGTLYNKSMTELIRVCPASSLVNFAIPQSVKTIGAGAFEGCKDITNIDMHDGIRRIGSSAFYNCGVTSLNLTENLKSVGANAFSYCLGLTKVTIPSSVTKLPDNAFWGCVNLYEVELPYELTEIGSGAFCGTGISDIILSEQIEVIGDNAFGNCKNLSRISLPFNVKSLGDYCFNECTALTEVTLPDGITSIGYSCFKGCILLTGIELPDSLAQIGDFAFYGCKQLSSVKLGSGVTLIGQGAFYGCTVLTDASYNGTAASWGNVVVGKDNDQLTKSLKTS